MKQGLSVFIGLSVFLILTASAGAESLYSAGKKGREAYDAGDYDKALDYYIKAQLEAPDKSEVFYNLGNAQYKTGDFDGALEHYKKALEASDPGLKQQTHYNMGNTYFRKNDVKQSLAEYEKALALDPDDEDARKNLAFVKKVLEEQEKQKDQKKGDQNQTDQDRNDQQNQDDQSKGDQENQSDGGQSESEPSGGQNDQDQSDKGGTPPPAQDGGEGDDGQLPRPDQAGPEGDERPDEQAMKQAETMLNRLKDNPGKALRPSYAPRRVDKDW